MDENELLFWFVAALLGLKLLWNLWLPYGMVITLIRDPSRGNLSTSPMIFVELILLVALVAMSSPVHERFDVSYLTAAAYGLAAIAFSYIHAFLVSFVALGTFSLLRKDSSNVKHDD